MTTVSVSEARAKLSQLLDKVVQGEQVIITRQGVPIATLVPIGLENENAVDQAIDSIRRLRQGRKLRPAKIRDLIDQGRL